MKAYIAGPMTGYPKFNFPAFEAATFNLRNQGHDIISPHESDSEAVQKAALASADGALTDGKIAGESWGQILAKDVRLVADFVDSIVFLPDWQDSKGARLEAYVGLLCGHKFYQYPRNPDPRIEKLAELSPEYVAGVCAAKWMPDEIRKLALAS